MKFSPFFAIISSDTSKMKENPMNALKAPASPFATVLPGPAMPFLIGEIVISSRSWTKFVIASILLDVTNAPGGVMLVATDGRALEPTDAIRTGNFCELDGNGTPIEPDCEDDVIAPVRISDPIPEGFTNVECDLPKKYRQVLGLRLSGYKSSRYEIITCYLADSAFPENRWRYHGNDLVIESGADIIGWRYADDWLMPVK